MKDTKGHGSEKGDRPKRVWKVHPQSSNGPFERQIREERSGAPSVELGKTAIRVPKDLNKWGR